MTDTQTGWWFSWDGENYEGGPFATYEEAVAAGGEVYDLFTVSLCTLKASIRIAEYIDEDVIDNVLERIEDETGNPEHYGQVVDLTTPQVADLIGHIRKAVDEWQDRSGVVLVPWRFEKVERSTEIDLAEKDDTK